MSNNTKTHIDEDGRVCLRCKVYKEWDLFYKVSRGAKGHDGTCIVCKKKQAKARATVDLGDDPKALDAALAVPFIYARVKSTDWRFVVANR